MDENSDPRALTYDVPHKPDPDEPLAAGDTFLVEGDPEGLPAIRGLQSLHVESDARASGDDLESEHIAFFEVVLSPRTALAKKTLRQLHFREKYGLTVVAICREGRIHRSNLGDMALHFGDALLLYGSREKLPVLGSEPDFLVLREEAQEPPRLQKAPIAASLMLAVVLPTSAVAILIAPIAFHASQDLGISPYGLMMAVALSAPASFMSPVAHPANVLIMGPGSYRFADYIKVGLPLTLVCFLVVVVVLPLVWPL